MLIQRERFPISDIIIFGFLPSLIKKFIYRLKGYKIGKKVSLSMGSVICGEDVSIGDHTKIGLFTIIRGKKVNICSFVNIGATTIIDTPYLEIGEGTRINEQVYVGGLQFPDSKLVIGRNCQIMQMSFLNPTRSIVIGDDTGIGGYCLLFGHTSWLSRFEGYPVEFAPIEVGNSVSLAWRVFLLPGTKIGDGAVIGANSLVNREIPEKCLAVGFPARVVSRYPDFPKEISAKERIDILHGIVEEMIKYVVDSGLDCTAVANDVYEICRIKRGIWKKGKQTWRMKIVYGAITENDIPTLSERLDVFLSLENIPEEMRVQLKGHNIMWIDIERKEQSYYWNDLGEEVVLFLKRFGVRLSRVKT